MPGRDLVVVGGSAGAVRPLEQLVAGLPPSFAGALLVVIHRTAELPGALPELLDRAGPLPTSFAVDGEIFRGGHVYVASPDSHLLVSGSRLRVTHGPRENGFRPAIDPLFR